MSYSSSIFHSYAIELNYKLFFVYATYFINLLYSKTKEWKKILSSKWFFKVFKNKLSFFMCIVNENIYNKTKHI